MSIRLPAPCLMARRGELSDRHPDVARVIEPSQVRNVRLVRTDDREVSIMCTDLAMHVASD